MKKEKKIKKSNLKEASKKELKRKNSGEIKKQEEEKKKILSTEVADENDFDIRLLREAMADCSSRYQALIVLAKKFGEDLLLYPSEIKALEIIGRFPCINLTQLANKLTISKSAVSKCSRKLLDKNLITKEKSQTNIREVVFLLTDSGKDAYAQLDRHQKEFSEPFDKLLKQFSKTDRLLFNRLFSELSVELKKIK